MQEYTFVEELLFVSTEYQSIKYCHCNLYQVLMEEGKCIAKLIKFNACICVQYK